MTVATSSESVHSVSCLSRGLALLGLHPSPSKRTPTPLSEKNLKLHTGSDSGSETSSTQSWFTVEKPQSPEQANETEKLPAPASDSTSQLAVETYEEDLPTYTEPSTLTVSVRYKHHEIYFLVKPTTRISIIKRGFANHYGSKGELRPEKLQLNYSCRKLRDRMTVAECGIEDGDEIHCMIDFDYTPMAG